MIKFWNIKYQSNFFRLYLFCILYACTPLEDEALSDYSAIHDQDLDYSLDMEVSTFDQDPVDQFISSSSLCDEYEMLPLSYPLTAHILPEASGLTHSKLHPHVLWSHNDSGDEAKLVALSNQGEILGELYLKYEAEDLEDISSSNCPHRSGYCIWLADTGDNRLSREYLNILILVEPATGLPFEPFEYRFDDRPSQLWNLPVILENGPADIEAIAAHQSGNKLWLFEKTENPLARIWLLDINTRVIGTYLQQLSEESKNPIIAQELITFSAPGIAIEKGKMITAADLSPAGDRLLLRVYTGMYEYLFDTPYQLQELSSKEPNLITLGPLSEPQGEALTYGWLGEGLWSISESLAEPQDLHYFQCLRD